MSPIRVSKRASLMRGGEFEFSRFWYTRLQSVDRYRSNHNAIALRGRPILLEHIVAKQLRQKKRCREKDRNIPNNRRSQIMHDGLKE